MRLGGWEHAYTAMFSLALLTALGVPALVDAGVPFVPYALTIALVQTVRFLLWVLVVDCCRALPDEAPRVFGLLHGAWMLGIALGVPLASQALPTVLAHGVLSWDILVLGMALCACYVAVLPEGRLHRLLDAARPAPAPRRRPFRERCGDISDRHGLTPRESEVMALIVRGHDTASIGERLGISATTVQTHRTHIYQKLGIHSRQELLALVERERDALSAPKP